MSYGIQVKNSSGFTQIDGLDRNLQIIATGTTANFPQAPQFSTPLPPGVDNSVVVFIAPNSTAGVGQGNTISIWGYVDFAANEFIIGRTLGFSFYQGSFNYVVCVDNQSEPTSGYGFNTYTNNGDLAFSSAYKQMKGVVHATFNVGTVSTPGQYTVFDEYNPAWAYGTNPQDYYVMLNALGRVGILNTGSTMYYRCSFATWGWSGTQSWHYGAYDNRVVVGGSSLAVGTPPTGPSVISNDTRTQIIARNI